MFALVVGKNGPKLKESTSTRSEMIDNGHHFSCERVTMEVFCKTMLQGELGRWVADKTGLTGEYDFTMDWVPDEGARRFPGEPGAASAPAGDGPSFFTAIQDQLGLKLEPTKGPVEVLVVDSAAFPSEN